MGGLKRKRSFDMSSPSSTSGSSPQAPSEAGVFPPSAFAFGESTYSPKFTFSSFMDMDQAQEQPHVGFDALMHSRTRKRFRDNRPDEEIIHRNTLNKLFAAQFNNQDISTPSTIMEERMEMEVDMPAPPPSPLEKNDRRQRTLHSFWNITAPPPSLLRSKSEPMWAESNRSDAFAGNDSLEQQMSQDNVQEMFW